MTSFSSADGGPIWIQFRRLVQNDMSTAVVCSKSKSDVEFQYGGRLGEFHGMSSQSHLPHCRVLPPGEFSGMSSHSQYHISGVGTWWIHVVIPEPHATRCNNSIRHIENRFSPYFILFCFLMQFGLWRAAAFVLSPIHLFETQCIEATLSAWKTTWNLFTEIRHFVQVTYIVYAWCVSGGWHARVHIALEEQTYWYNYVYWHNYVGLYNLTELTFESAHYIQHLISFRHVYSQYGPKGSSTFYFYNFDNSNSNIMKWFVVFF